MSRFLAFLLLGLVVLAGGLTWGGSTLVQRQARTDPGYCSQCHADVAEHVVGHEAEACQSCHVIPDAPFQLAVASAFLGDEAVPWHGEFSEASCADCHRKDERGWRLLMSMEGHATHADSGEVECSGCHAPTVHDPEIAPADTCLDCHESVPMPAGEIASRECVGCHAFSPDEGFVALEGDGDVVQNAAPRPDAAGWGADVAAHRVHGAADCRSCHNPHEAPPPVEDRATDAGTEVAAFVPPGDDAGFGAYGVAEAPDCTSCHRGALLEQVSAGPEAHTDCGGCHEVHADRDDVAKDCTSCHAPPGGAPVRTRGADAWRIQESPLTAAQQRVVASMTHEGECATCHVAHEWTASEQGCRDCHEEAVAQIARLPGRTHEDCLGCHAPHAPEPTSAACWSCHAEIRQVASANVAEPHQTCLGCHEAHLGNAAAQASCASCHTQITRPQNIHQGTCLECHDAHQATGGVASDCASCHGEVSIGVAAHECSGCHAPHVRAELAIATCSGCHAEVLEPARTWPAGSAHASAGECAECHEAHREQSPIACSSCHAEQAVDAHVGAHEDCVGCHAPHRAVPQTARGWEQSCANAGCHGDISRQVWAASGVHGTCEGCHEQPGPPLPTCQSCHGADDLLLGHRQAGHVDASCESCHATHSVATPTKQTCFACHGELEDEHFPDAATCLSCHPFAGSETAGGGG